MFDKSPQTKPTLRYVSNNHDSVMIHFHWNSKSILDPLWDPCGIVVGYPYMGFHQICQCGPHMGFMRAIHIMWVCIGYTKCETHAGLCGLPNWVCNGFPTRAPHWLPMWAWSWYFLFIPKKWFLIILFFFWGVFFEFSQSTDAFDFNLHRACSFTDFGSETMNA